MSSHHRSLANGAGSAEAQASESVEDITSPIIPSDPEFDSNDEQQPPTRSPTPTPPYESRPSRGSYLAAPPAAVYEAATPGYPHQNGHLEPRQLHVPEALRRHNSSFVPFSEIPTLPAFLNNCNLSQYLQSFNEAGAADDAMPLILDFDDDELKSIMDAIPMKPFHAATFRMGVRDLRERSRMGSMHFDNSQSSFMHPEPHSMLHYSHSQFFQQPSQPQLPPQLSSQPPSQQSQNSHPSQNAPNSQPTRRYSQSHLQNGQPSNLHRQPSARIGGHWSSSQGNGTSGGQAGGPTPPTPSQVLSGGAIHQHAGGVTRAPSGYYHPQPVPQFSQEHPPVQRSLSNSQQNEHKQGIKRRRSTESPPVAVAEPSSSPVLPEPSSYNSNSSSSWSSTPKAVGGAHLDNATREMILHQALVFGKHSSRQLTKYEHAINCAAQTLALEDPTLLSHKGKLWDKAKAKLLEEDYDYKRGRSRSKLPEMTAKKETKISKEQLIMKREANASNAATIRIRRIASLNDHYNQKNRERDHILDLLLQIESNENKAARPKTWEAEAAQARVNLGRVEVERAELSKELGSLKNKERKHQWYEKRKKGRVGEDRSQEDKNTDVDADEEAEGGTDTTVDPEGENSQAKASPQTGLTSKPTSATTTTTATNGAATTTNGATKQEAVPPPKPLTWKPHIPVVQDDSNSKASSSRSKKHKDVFRTSEYTAATKS